MYGVTCNGLPAQASVNYTAVLATAANVAAPSATLTSADAQQTAGQSTWLTWHSEIPNSSVAGGGNTGEGWRGSLATSGSMAVTESNAGSVNYSVTCSGAPPAATATTVVAFVAATAAAPRPAVPVGPCRPGGYDTVASTGEPGAANTVIALSFIGSACWREVP
jgi:hypothetical protein